MHVFLSKSRGNWGGVQTPYHHRTDALAAAASSAAASLAADDISLAVSWAT